MREDLAEAKWKLDNSLAHELRKRQTLKENRDIVAHAMCDEGEDKIEVEYPFGSGKWVAARATSKYDDGSFDVEYDHFEDLPHSASNVHTEIRVEKERIRWLGPSFNWAVLWNPEEGTGKASNQLGKLGLERRYADYSAVKAFNEHLSKGCGGEVGLCVTHDEQVLALLSTETRLHIICCLYGLRQVDSNVRKQLSAHHCHDR